MIRYSLPWNKGFFCECLQPENDVDSKVLEDLAYSLNVTKWKYIFEEWIDSEEFKKLYREGKRRSDWDTFYDGYKIIFLIEE